MSSLCTTADRCTQQWVRVTGRLVSASEYPWLAGPVGEPTGIGADYCDRYAERNNLRVVRDGPARGLIASISQLAGGGFDPSRIEPAVADFYERTSEYEFQAWSQWCGIARPFGGALALIFSRRLQQLNVPLSALDTRLGARSEVLHLVDPATRDVLCVAWVRELLATGNVLYAGSYGICTVPGCESPCVKVVFPLPNGNAIVLLRPASSADGSLTLSSVGRRFGDPGFYFTVVRADGCLSARYVHDMQETIHVYRAGGDLRTDHSMRLFGRPFLQLHYLLRLRQ